MEKVNWRALLNWTEDEFEDIRNAGFSYLRQGKYEIAQVFFEALVTINSENVYDYQTLGALYLQLDDPAKAIRYFERALQYDGDHSFTLINLAKAFFSLNRKDEGLKLAELLQNDANPSIAQMAKALKLAWGD